MVKLSHIDLHNNNKKKITHCCHSNMAIKQNMTTDTSDLGVPDSQWRQTI